ncbi:MAG: hypothetical protein II843_02605 [Alphaproteobacteria bacterium]|nr:hypothetical protein [Alphaproteobacteria bacterium]MBQ6012214.1 hypothetical protein [Alphaproteobacteria bacterium]
MAIDKQTSNNHVRVVTTKTGTHIIWYDEKFRARRYLNLSRVYGTGRYLGTGR